MRFHADCTFSMGSISGEWEGQHGMLYFVTPLLPALFFQMTRLWHDCNSLFGRCLAPPITLIRMSIEIPTGQDPRVTRLADNHWTPRHLSKYIDIDRLIMAALCRC